MADRTLPDLVGTKVWRRDGTWNRSARMVAALTAFTFTFFQFAAPFASAEQDPIPTWLKEDKGGWVSADKAQRMQKADQDMLAHLSTLEQAQQRFITTNPSGLQAQYANQELVVARDAQGNLLWSPTFDDYQRVQNGTLLLVDGTLQTVRDGRMTRQVAVDGTETFFRTDGRVDHETVLDGTRTDYSYSGTGFTRTTHNPNGDLVQEYNAEGRLIRETTPEGKISTYSNGILASVTAGGFLYTYSSATNADGTITATLSEARGADGALYTLANGELATIRWSDGTLATGVQLDAQGNLIAGNVLLPNGTQQTIAAGTIRDVQLTDGRSFHYDAGWLRQMQTGNVVSAYSYTFNPGGNLSSITVTAADGSARTYTPAGVLQGLSDPNGTRWTVAGGLITQSTVLNGTAATYTRLNTPYGQQLVRQSGAATDRFSFDAAGRIYAAGTDKNLAGATPFTTPLQSFSAGTLTNAGIVATDGTYLYVKPWSNTSKVFTKVGTGFGGTVAGKVYGTITGSVGSTMSASMHSDGFLYQPDPTNPARVDRINPTTGAKGFVAVPAGLLRLETAKAEKGNALITSDGRYVYNLSYHQTRNSTTYNGWTVRVFDPQNGWALVKEFTAGTTSFKANGLMSDGTFLYAVEWTNSNSARVAVIRISDGAVVGTWTANQGTTKIVGGQYDWINQRFWLGAKSTGKVYAYDDPNDLPLSDWVEREGLRTPIAQTQLGDMDRVPQPANPYFTDLQTRVEQDLPGVRLTYPGQPGAVPTTPADGLWNQAEWPVTPDTLPPTGTMEMPALTDQREITMTLSALDPATADGTSGSGVRMMRFSFNGGETWAPPEPFTDSKAVTLPEQDGDYTVQAQFQDVAGHWSEPLARTVSLRLGSGTPPPVLSLISAGTTDTELYDFIFAADGVPQPAQRWRLAIGQNRFIASVTNPSGKESFSPFTVTRSGTLPEPVDPPPLPQGDRLTETLTDGSVAAYVNGALVSITTTDGTQLLQPGLDGTGKITGGWLTTPDGTTTFLQNGAALWSKDVFGTITWYFSDGKTEAARTTSGVVSTDAYSLTSSNEITSILVSTPQASYLYDPQGKLLASITSDGQPITDPSPDGPSLQLSIQQINQKIQTVSLLRNGITRTYDTVGQLKQVTLSDQTTLQLTGQNLQAVQLSDGTTIQNGVYDANNQLVSGTVTLPDGRTVTYADSQPTEATLPDGTTITYAASQPSTLTLSGGLSYLLSHTSTGWAAGLQTTPPASDSLTRMTYSTDWVLQQATRADEAKLVYQNGRLNTLTQVDGTVISYAYDDTGRLTSTVAGSTDPSRPAIRSEYAYDRIRRVFKGESLIYDYSYEFDADGAEITVVQEVATGLTKRYRAGLLISQTDADGAVTTYEYTTSPAGYQDPFQNTLEARQTLPDGSTAYYRRADNSSPWQLRRLVLPDGSEVPDLTAPQAADLVQQAQLPTDRLSLFRLERQDRLEAVNAPAAATSAGSPKIMTATVQYQGRTRDSYTYQYDGTLTRVTDQEGVTRVYDEANQLVAIEQIEGPSYWVSAARDLSTEQTNRLAQLDPSSAEALDILTHPAGDTISVHRLTRLNNPDGMAITRDFPPNTIVEQEFDSQGQLISRTQANGQTTLYESGHPTRTLNAQGEVTTTFAYDAAGQLVKLTLLAARQELTDESASARAEVIRRRADALEELAVRKQLAVGQIANQTAQARSQLQAELEALGHKLNDVEAMKVHGSSAKKQKSQALDQIRAGMNQVRSALSSLDQQYSQALGGLESQVESVRNQLESQSASAFTSITSKEQEFTKAIIRQEITVILTRVYRNIIGRDPDETETAQAVDQLYAQFGANPDATLDLTALGQKIRALPDYPVRVQQVAQIRQAVSDRLTAWTTASEAQKALQLAPYGITLSQTVLLDSAALTEIRTWLNTNSLHFGHSAFLALQGLLAQAKGIQVDTVTLATEAVWLDILTGVISPKTTGDLELSLFSLQHVSQRYGLSVTPARISLEELKAMLPRELTLFQVVSPDGGTSYELKDNGSLEVVQLSSGNVTQTLSLFGTLQPPSPALSLFKQPDGSLTIQTRGLPVGGVVSVWTDNDLNGEAGVYYIKPVDMINSYYSLPSNGVARLPFINYRPGHTRVLVFKDTQAIATFQQRQRELHPWSPLYATNFIKDMIVTRPGVSYKISDLDWMKADSGFMDSTGLMVFDMAADGSLVQMSGFWNPPVESGMVSQKILLSPDGNTLWVLATGKSRTGSVLLSVNLRTGAVSKVEAGLISPAQIALSTDGTRLYVQDSASPEGGASALAVLDAATGQILKRAPLSVGNLAGLVVSASNQILLAGKGGNQIFFLDAATLQTVRVATGYGSIASLVLRPDGQVTYILDSSLRQLVVLSVATGQILAQIAADGASDQVAFSPDGTILYLTRQDTGTVLRIDAANYQPVPDVRQGETNSDQAFRSRTAPILAHVNGNHYLHVLAVTADGKILVREPNKGPNGSIVALSAEEFSRIWQGVILSPRAPPHAYQRLTDSETLSITGSFFPLLIPIFIAIATAVTTVVTVIVSAVAALLAALGTLLTSVFTALGTAFSSIGTFFGGFGSLFSGAGLIGQGFSALFAGQLLTGLSLIGHGLLGVIGLSSFSWASLGQFAFTTAANIGISKGLEALGVNSTFSSLAGAFVSGGISGALNPVSTTSSFLTKFVAGALTSTAIAGTQMGLVKVGLDPALANIAGIGVGTITNSLTLSGLNGLGQTLSTQLAPTLAGELAFYGIQKLGQSIGLDPRISQLAGITLSHGIGNIANPGTTAQNVLKGMQDGLTGGALQLGLSFATQGLDPLLGGLASSAITGAIDGLVSPANPSNPVDPKKRGIFGGIADGLTNALGGFTDIGLIKAGDPVGNAQRLAQLNDFSSIIREQGLGTALETYATGLLYRSSVESLIHAGNSLSIQQIVDAQLRNPLVVDLEGRNVIQIALGNGGYLWVDPTTHGLVASLQRQDYIRYVSSPKVDPVTGIAGTPDVIIERTYPIPNDATSLNAATITARIREEISAGGVVKVTIEGRNGTRYTVTPNSLQHARLNADGTVADGILTDANTGVKLYFQDGKLVKTHRPVTLISKDPTTGEPTLTLDAGAVTETLSPEGQLKGLAIELAHELQNRYGPMTVQFSEDGRGALFVDQEGRLILQYRDGKVVETTVLGDVTKLVKLWEGIPGMMPQGFTLPAERVQLERDMGTMLQSQFSQNPEKTRQALDDFNAHKAELVGLSIPLGSVPSKQILNPPLKSRRPLAGGVIETTEEYTYLGYMPTAPSTTDFTLVYDPTRGYFLEFDTKATVQKIGASELYAYATAKRTWYGDAKPFSVAAGGGSDFTLTTADQIDVTGTMRIGVGTGGLTVTAKAQGMKDGQQMGAVQTKSFTANEDDSVDPFNLSIKNLMTLFNPSAIKPTEMILDLGLLRTTFMSGQDPLGIGQQMGDQLIGLIRHHAEIQGVRIIELK